MASGTPIVASDVLGIHDLLEGIGVLVNPPTIDNFRKSIEYLIENNKLRKSLGIKGVEYAKNFKWSRVVKSLEDVYINVINNHNKALKK
jgi:glycosyltransferase involved in cell wall biosynthesis